MRLSVFFLLIFLISSVSSNAADRNDSLFQRLSSINITEMSDIEFQYFFEIQQNNRMYDACSDKSLNEIKIKDICLMNQNEYTYFSTFIFQCDSINPCSIRQFLDIKKKSNKIGNESSFNSLCDSACTEHLSNSISTENLAEIHANQTAFEIGRIVLFIIGIVITVIIPIFGVFHR